MEESDRTAIHEVMEQQTVSIAKAGITTTLNARTAVLAAANPAGGRYNTAWSPQDNINLPAALLSRFDIMWLILDRADVDGDTALAAHVLHVHRHLTHPVRKPLLSLLCIRMMADALASSSQTLEFQPLPAADLRAYVALARRVSPHFPPDLTEYVATAYAELRQEEADIGDQAHSYTTARTLLSILRLASALARLRFAPEVAQSDVDEALRLMRMSKASLADESSKSRRGPHGGDPISEIFALLRNLAEQRNVTEISYTDAVVRSPRCVLAPVRRSLAYLAPVCASQELVARRAYGTDLLDACLEEYESLNVWHLDEEKNITFGE
jgi:DNA replication licensing factor MCM7